MSKFMDNEVPIVKEPEVVSVSDKTTKSQKFGTPQAIVIAGLLIALAVFVKAPSGQIIREGEQQTFNTKSIGVNTKKVAACIAEKDFKEKIDNMAKEAQAQGASGTPFSLVIGKNGAIAEIGGALPLENAKTIIDSVLNATGPLAGQKAYTFTQVTELDHIKGNMNADVVIVEYSDIECTFCKRFHKTMNEVVNSYGDKVAWVYRHFPLESIHKNARPWAIESECVAEIGGNESFWKYIDERFKD